MVDVKFDFNYALGSDKNLLASSWSIYKLLNPLLNEEFTCIPDLSFKYYDSDVLPYPIDIYVDKVINGDLLLLLDTRDILALGISIDDLLGILEHSLRICPSNEVKVTIMEDLIRFRDSDKRLYFMSGNVIGYYVKRVLLDTRVLALFPRSFKENTDMFKFSNLGREFITFYEVIDDNTCYFYIVTRRFDNIKIKNPYYISSLLQSA